MADHVVDPLVVLAVAVAEVQPGDVHAGLDQLPDLVRSGRGRPERTDDLRAAIHVNPQVKEVSGEIVELRHGNDAGE